MPPATLRLSGRTPEDTVEFPLERSGPGRWKLSNTTIPPGAYAYALTIEKAAGSELVSRGTLSTGPALEYRHLDNNERFLSDLASVGGGEVLASPEDVDALVTSGIRRLGLWPLLLGLALLLVLYDVAAGLWTREQ